MHQTAPALINYWRAHIGRFPRAMECEVYYLFGKYGWTRVRDAVVTVARANHRRTKDRVTLFYAFLGESPPFLGLDL